MRYAGTARADSQTAVSHLLSAAILLSPDERAAAGFTRLVIVMVNAGEQEQDVAEALVAALRAGLRTGNWPS